MGPTWYGLAPDIRAGTVHRTVESINTNFPAAELEVSSDPAGS
jgi:hypothetical protein